MRTSLQWLLRIGVGALLVIVTVYLVRAFGSRSMPSLMPEHGVALSMEFRAADEADTDWTEYLQRERAMMAQVRTTIGRPAGDALVLDRHAADSPSNAETYAVNWNHTQQLTADRQRGVAVLIHGLSDSPYSVRASAEFLRDQGMTALAMRMPGHGFAVGQLRHARWEDWMAALRIAMREAQRLRQPDQPLLLLGYSNGGLLAIRYALDCGGTVDVPCPDGLLLISPAIDVTPFARFGQWHKAVSWLPYFAQFQWESIGPEVDPYKFTSFPKSPGLELFRAARSVKNDLPGQADRLPPMIAFQSLVDDTVSTEAVIELFRSLPNNGSELVLYDVNRFEAVVSLMNEAPLDLLEAVEQVRPLPFDVTVVTNAGEDSRQVNAVTYPAAGAAQTRSLQMGWPESVFSLSHIALPFRPDDPVYGLGRHPDQLNIGAIAPRGERKVLRLTPNYFARLRYNPFFDYQQRRISRWLEQSLGLEPIDQRDQP